MRMFESQALGQYGEHLAVFALPEKRALLDQLTATVPGDEVLAESELYEPMQELLASAETTHLDQTLIVQGLVLERVRHVIYRTLQASPGATATTKELAARAAPVSDEISTKASELLAERLTDGAFQRFAELSDDVLHKLDAVGEGVDRVFGERFQLHFTEVVGEFVSDLVPVCVGLGMDRRKVMTHLAGALMGL
jgi:hypothetical protein